MKRVIRIQGDGHRQIQLQLPWYAAGKLEPTERDRVEAHLATCAECRAELASEHRLDAEIAALTPEVAHGWERLQARLEPRSSHKRRPLSGVLSWLRAGTCAGPGAMTWQGWTIAAQAAVLLVISGFLLLREDQTAPYLALGARAAPIDGNAVVMFRPDTLESTLRTALVASEARLVDGPTPAGAYVLQVPEPRRAMILAALKRRPEVTLAEPVDVAASP